MSSSSEPLRVAMVGVGRRARHTLLPALFALGDRVVVEAAFGRTARSLALEAAGGRPLAVRDDLGDADLSGIDVVVVALPLRAVPDVLRRLEHAGASGATLMLDTPVLHHRDLDALDLLDRFRDVVVSEDAIALPPFTLARQLVDEGRIGDLTRISLFHSGYRHHALATLQELVGRGRPTRVRVRRWGRGSAEIRVLFRGGVEGVVVEPRDYGVGRFLVAGSEGFIADYPIRHKHATVIGYDCDRGRYRGLLLDGEPVPPSALDQAFQTDLAAGLEDESTMALLKVRGFMSLVDAVATGAPTPRKQPIDALVDDLSLRVAERTGHWVDPRLARSGPASTTALRLLAAAEGRRSRSGR
jgi:predicted dehydrogenase